ncbi:right-handed parallel beta-helix repeat-containing protein [Paenibacillus glycanilyticus]|uniref:Rhamnogalacturonase A/B/Epimerase-like pectate lyase domain-containing protein n=1 Tax=Paenibacillus glycanilyticus TaxID=126569 RepID=A0ABQ6G5V5_9BACL|nr:right-handed parallel beta-helix repeat-containing protein [Paenibacillus glycanilyticus]GLX66344.1 hypothetical protein MU1_06880 [Paenibacillus glycanilyticus]
MAVDKNTSVVTDFGAIGDGVSDDTAAFQAAINAGAGQVYVPKGSYVVKNISIPSNISLIGAGAGSVLKLHPSSVDWDMVIRLIRCSNVKISNLTIDGNRGAIGLADNQMHGIGLDSETANITVENVTIKNTCGDGIWIAGGSMANPAYLSKNIMIRDCYISNAGRQSIALVMGDQISMIGNVMDGQLDIEAEELGVNDVNVVGNIAGAIAYNNPVNGGGRVTITGNNVIKDVYIWGSSNFTFSSNAVKGKIRIENSSYGTVSNNWCSALICSGTAEGLNEQISFVGNTVDSTSLDLTDNATNGAAAWVWNSQGITFSSNNIISPKRHGILIDGGVSNIRLTANQLIDTAGTTATNGIGKVSYGGDSHIHIANNSIRNYNQGFKSDGSASSSIGTLTGNIMECRTANVASSILDNLVVEHNTFIGNAVVGFYYSQNVMIRYNRFLNTATTSRLLQVENCTSPVTEANYFKTGTTPAQLSANGSTGMNQAGAVWRQGSGQPAVNSDFIGQTYVDTASKLAYVATGSGAASADWQAVGKSGVSTSNSTIYSPSGIPFKPSVSDGGVVTWAFAGKAYDTFTRANSTTSAGAATVGGTWVAQNGKWGISNNQLYSASNGNTEKLTLPAVTGDYTLTADVLGTLDNNTNYSVPQLMIRYVDSNNHMKIYLQSGFLRLEALIANNNVVLASASATTASKTTYRISVSVTASTIMISVDGAQKISHTLSSANQTIFGTNGVTGVRLLTGGSPAAAARWDNYLIT